MYRHIYNVYNICIIYNVKPKSKLLENYILKI